MKLLITGGAGFIGSALVRHAIACGHDVLNVDKLTYASNLNSLGSVRDDPRYRFLQADICDGDAMRRAIADFQPDIIFNLAAETHVDRSIDGPDDFIRTNIGGVHTLLEVCREAMAAARLPGTFRFVQVSTDEVFGSIESGCFDETSSYRPSSPYSASKASADMLVQAWTKTFDFPAIITNCSNNYGPWQFPEKFIPTIISKAVRGEPVPVYGDGQQVRDWLFVNDHAEALLLAGETGRTGEVYCVGGGTTMPNVELARLVCDLVDRHGAGAAGKPSRELITFVDDRPGHDRRYAIDHGKITRELGWKPASDLERGLAATVDWYMANRDWLNRLAASGQAGQRLGVIKGGLV